jgi:hypothetical protein
MKTTLADIKALIKTKLESILDGGSHSIFGDIFDYPNGEFKNYPVVVILDSGMSGIEIDTARNERTFHFSVNLFQEQTKAGKTNKEASELMERAADKIIEAFDKDPDLGGEVLRVSVVEAIFDFKVTAGTFNFATFKIDCMSVVPNY